MTQQRIVMDREDFDVALEAVQQREAAQRVAEIAVTEAKATLLRAIAAEQDVFRRLRARYPSFLPSVTDYVPDVEGCAWVARERT
jgi:hypothetical protein